MFRLTATIRVGVLGAGAAAPLEPRAKTGHGSGKSEPGQSVSVVARRNGINAHPLFLWRKLYQDGNLSAFSTRFV